MAIRTEHSATIRAFEEPALDVLRSRHAPWTIALLREAFGTDAAAIPAEDMIALVEAGTNALRADGYDVPDEPPNRVVHGLVKTGLLSRYNDPDGRQMVRPTSAAQRALEYVRELSGDHRMISASRVKTIVEVARVAAFDATESRAERIAALEQQRAGIDAEIERLRAGGEVSAVTPDGFVQAFSNLVDQVGGLPADFLAITDSLDELRRDVLERYREEQLSRSDIVDLYADRTRGMLQETPEGRAYLGAHELFLDETLLDSLRAHIDALVRHPHAALISRADREQAMATADTISAGMNQVLERRDAVVRTISTRIREHDAMRHRELMDALDRAAASVTQVLERTSGRWRRELSIMPEKVALKPSLRAYPDRTRRSRPKPLAASNRGAAGTSTTWDEVRKLSGPHFPEIDVAIRAARAAGGSTVGAVIEYLPAGCRRPIDLLGIIHRGYASRTDQRERVTMTRGDGSTVTYSIPRIAITPEEPHHG